MSKDKAPTQLPTPAAPPAPPPPPPAPEPDPLEELLAPVKTMLAVGRELLAKEDAARASQARKEEADREAERAATWANVVDAATAHGWLADLADFVPLSPPKDFDASQDFWWVKVFVPTVGEVAVWVKESNNRFAAERTRGDADVSPGVKFRAPAYTLYHDENEYRYAVIPDRWGTWPGTDDLRVALALAADAKAHRDRLVKEAEEKNADLEKRREARKAKPPARAVTPRELTLLEALRGLILDHHSDH